MTNGERFKDLFSLYATEVWAMPEKDFLEWLNTLTTAAEPKHGRWEMYGTITRGTLAISIYRCSECKEDTNNCFWHYCPNCGAKMEEVEE